MKRLSRPPQANASVGATPNKCASADQAISSRPSTPLPEHYGLPRRYSWEANKGRIESRTKLVSFFANVFGFLVAASLAYMFAPAIFATKGFGGLVTAFSSMFGGLFVISASHHFATNGLQKLLMRPSDKDAQRYGADLEAFEYRILETGLGFWQAMRGVEFERALMRLFHDRGCRADMTKASGDGGVDLKFTLGDQMYWCQCKGLSKPVSVAPIREIAGVCSKSDAQPVVFAVNGFTRPAIEEASRLNVVLLDAPNIVEIARLETVATL